MSIIDPAGLSLSFLLKRAQHAFRTRVDRALRPFNLTAPQYAVLVAIKREAGLSNADLAREAFVTPQTMQGILFNLEKLGYLTRTPHPQHGRILQSALTERGHKVYRETRKHVADIEKTIAISAGSDAQVFAHVLARCADDLEST